MARRFVVIGKEGYIACALMERLHKERISFVKTSFDPKDGDWYLQLEKPNTFDYNQITENDFIVFLAAISSPDICTNQYDYTYRINVTGTIEFIKQCVKRNANVLFISSDTVLGNANTIVNENFPPCPFGNYAEMKHEVEEFFKDNPNIKVFRFSYVFSRDDKFSKYVLQSIKKGEDIEIFNPFSRRVVYIQDVIDAIIRLEDNWEILPQKIFHIAGPALVSRKDIAELFIKQIESPIKYSIIRDDKEFFKERKRIIDMDSLFIEQLLGKKPTSIKDAVQREVEIMKEAQ